MEHRRRVENIPQDDPRLREGIELFNTGKFFESHEVWESLWHEVDGKERSLLQGLIQIAAAYHHLSRDNRTGACELYTKGRARLIPWSPRHRGIELDAFLKQLDATFERIQHGGSVPAIPPHLDFLHP